MPLLHAEQMFEFWSVSACAHSVVSDILSPLTEQSAVSGVKPACILRVLTIWAMNTCPGTTSVLLLNGSLFFRDWHGSASIGASGCTV